MLFFDKVIFKGELGECMYNKLHFNFIIDECEKKIHEGGYGWIYLGKHLETEDIAALKIFKPITTVTDSIDHDIKAGFRQDLDMEYLMRYKDYCVDTSGKFECIVMDLMESSLYDVIKPSFYNPNSTVNLKSNQLDLEVIYYYFILTLIC
jgi:serine/threonine protein kinase